MVYTINGEQLTRRELVTIDGSMTTTETGIPLALNIVLLNVKAAGADVRLAKLDGTPIAREIECVDVPSTDAVMLHYPFDTISGTNSQFYVYWGNPNLTEPAADSTYGSQAVWQNYKAVWHFNQEPNGAGANSILDSTDNANHLTPHGWVANSLKDGLYGKYIDFDYSNSNYMDVDGTDFVFATTDFTIFTQLRSDDAGGDYLFSKLNTANANDGYFARYSSTVTYLQMREYGTAEYISVDGGGSSANNWHTMSVSIDRDSATGMREIDDGGSATIVNPTGVTDISSTGDLFIGVLYSLTGFISADMNETRISSVKRSDDYIVTTHKNLNNPTASGTLPFYKSISTPQHQRRTPQFIN